MQNQDYQKQLELLANKLEKKYNIYVEIYRLTKELDEVFRSNDKDSIKIVMKMRGEEMDRINGINEEILELYRFFPKEIVAALKKNPQDASYPNELEKIMGIRKRNQLVIEKTIEIDRKFSNRIAGRKSFYGGL